MKPLVTTQVFGTPQLRRQRRQTKIRNPNCSGTVEQQVSWLDVAMQRALFVSVGKRVGNLLTDSSDALIKLLVHRGQHFAVVGIQGL